MQEALNSTINANMQIAFAISQIAIFQIGIFNVYLAISR